MKQGKVYLVGAGPGRSRLNDRQGLDCLRHADVIIYDRLVDESLLNEARPEAEKIYVGKADGLHILEQDSINQLLLEKARRARSSSDCKAAILLCWDGAVKKLGF